jgi:CheY-like chemotaxis protein
MKDEFIAVVSHELRTPLTAILLWSKMLRAGLVKPEEQSRVIDTIEQSAVAQQQVVEDLLDVSRMMSGKLRLNVRETEPVPVVQAAIDAVRPMADAKRLTLETDLDPRAGTVRADPDRLQQVVWNLVNNAVKFTPAGGRVAITLRRFDGNLQVQVADDGKGMPPEFLPHVFDRFRQAETSTTRRHGGLGLGLAICRQLVELHGGTISAESPGRDQGSTFTVELPLADVRAGTTKPPPRDVDPRAVAVPFQPAPMLRGLSVLLVEDDPNTRLALRRLMEQAAAEVTAVESAAQAVAAFRDRLDQDRRFDMIVSDIAMPVQDGYELIRELRELEARLPNSRRVPAIALTAYAREHDRARALAAGFDTHVPKPVEPSALVAGVAALTGRGVH